MGYAVGILPAGEKLRDQAGFLSVSLLACVDCLVSTEELPLGTQLDPSQSLASEAQPAL